jgi:hypothetical protein
VLSGPAVQFTVFAQKKGAPHSGWSVDSSVAFTQVKNVSFPHGANTVYKRVSGTCMQAENLTVFALDCQSFLAVERFLNAYTQVAVPNKALTGFFRWLLLSCSNEECARYLETIKMYENKPADNIQERTDHDYLSRVSFFFLSSRSSPVLACALVACAW